MPTTCWSSFDRFSLLPGTRANSSFAKGRGSERVGHVITVDKGQTAAGLVVLTEHRAPLCIFLSKKGGHFERSHKIIRPEMKANDLTILGIKIGSLDEDGR